MRERSVLWIINRMFTKYANVRNNFRLSYKHIKFLLYII